jgi:hypothetical protein
MHPFDPCLRVEFHYRLTEEMIVYSKVVGTYIGIKQKQHFVHRNCFAFGGIGRRVLCRNVRTVCAPLRLAVFTCAKNELLHQL